MLFQKKKKEISAQAKEKINPLKFEVSIRLKSEGPYSCDSGDVTEIKFEKVLHSTSDSPVREILKEFAGHLESVYEQAEIDVKQSRCLSDGYHKLTESEKREIDEE